MGDAPGIFISHASRDRELVDELADLLKIGSGVPHNSIFNTDGAGAGVPSGVRFNEYIRSKVQGTGMVIAVLSPAFLSSAFCLAEIGAAWALQEDFFPLAVPGLDRSRFGGVLDGVQVRFLDDPVALAELHDRVSAKVEQRVPTETWRAQQQRFLERTGVLLARASAQSQQPRSEQEVQAELQTALQAVSGSDALFTFDDAGITAFPDFVADAESVQILGRTAVNVLGQYEYVFRRLLENGTTIRIMMVNPESAASKYLYGQRETVFRRNHDVALGHIEDLREYIDTGALQIRTCEESPPFSLVIAQRPQPLVSQVNIQLNMLYSRVGRDRPVLRLAEGDRWYNSFTDEYEQLWKRGKRWPT